MRTKVVLAALTLGLVGAFASGSTLAVFSDFESSEDNVFSAGELDLRLDYNESYNGEFQERQPLASDIDSIFELDDVKPGDHGNGTISFQVDTNPAYVFLVLNQTEDLDNTCTEPEDDVEDSGPDDGCDFDGELDHKVRFEMWYDDGDGVKESDEQYIVSPANDTRINEAFGQPINLDSNLSTQEQTAYQPGDHRFIGWRWRLPPAVGNRVQTDSFKFDFVFYAEQERNNPDPDNPFA
jgi:predicted ribosomally synthesized peptide with SipW-like signal peptide